MIYEEFLTYQQIEYLAQKRDEDWLKMIDEPVDTYELEDNENAYADDEE